LKTRDEHRTSLAMPKQLCLAGWTIEDAINDAPPITTQSRVLVG
jgi:hypothetical protein